MRGFDFADFLLGLPQQASIQYGPGNVKLRGRSYSAYWQDDWRKGPGLTLNLGVRYDLVRPYTEADGQMVNLDATPDFTAVTPVLSGETGPYSGRVSERAGPDATSTTSLRRSASPGVPRPSPSCAPGTA